MNQSLRVKHTLRALADSYYLLFILSIALVLLIIGIETMLLGQSGPAGPANAPSEAGRHQADSSSGSQVRVKP